jgi:16S rRNA (uracil1498-N3)-methyltransferase
MDCVGLQAHGGLTLTRFFVEPSQIAGAIVFLGPRDSHHLTAVLKRRVGDEILICDGSGTEYLVILQEVNKTAAVGKIVDMYRLATEPSIMVTVAQALPRTLDKLEWVLQHGTELGAVRFVPFYSTRSREDWKRLISKKDRWQEIVRSAAEQSRRAICPHVEEMVSFDTILASASSFDLTIFANENERTTSLKAALSQVAPKNLLVIVGPEGGFTEIEARTAAEHNAISVSLGPRILRTETAALCLLSQIYYALETL